MKVLSNNGKVLNNNKVNALRVENTNAFSFGVVTTDQIRVYWGDGSYTDIGTKTARYTIIKNYSVTGNYNIVITNTDNITSLFFLIFSNK